MKKVEKLWGTTQAAMLMDNLTCPDVLTMSTYDMKPVHLLLMVAELVKWITNKRKVQDREKKVDMNFLWLNVINEYNKNMNGTNMANQLQGVYWPDHWMGHRECW